MKLQKILMLASFLAIALFLAACQTSPTGQVVLQQAPASASTPAAAPALQQPATPVINITDVSYDVTEGDKATVKWKIESAEEGTVAETALLYGVQTQPRELGTDVTPASAGYRYMSKDYADSLVPLKMPGTYHTTFNMPAENIKGNVLHLRAYALINGKNYWSQEQSINIIPTESGSKTPQEVLTEKQEQIDS